MTAVHEYCAGRFWNVPRTEDSIFWKVMNKKDSLPPIGDRRNDIVIADTKGAAGGEKKAENQLL